MHTAELTRLELIPGGALEAEHEKLSFKVNYLFIQLFGGLGSDFLQFLVFLRHHHYRRGIRGPSRPHAGAARGAQMSKTNAME